MSTGPGRHWFVVHRISSQVVEIFDSLGCNEEFLREIKLSAIYQFNITPVQCSGSQLCGPFVIYFIILRYLNLDMELGDFLNDYFTLDCSKNEENVKMFLNQI